MSTQYGGGSVHGGGMQPPEPDAGHEMTYSQPAGHAPASSVAMHGFGPPLHESWTQS